MRTGRTAMALLLVREHLRDGGAHELDLHVVVDLQHRALLVDRDDRRDDAARGEDLVALLQRVEGLLELLLLFVLRADQQNIG